MTGGNNQGFPWGDIGGAGLNAAGQYASAQFGASQAAQAAEMSELAKAWTQLLGMKQIGQSQKGLKAGLGAHLQSMGGAASLAGLLPGVAAGGTQRQLGQIAGSEQSAISQVMRNQQGMSGGLGQSQASGGFYGSSIHGAQSNQVRANTNQAIGDIMSGLAGQKAGVIGQGTQAMMAGITGAAQAQQALGASQFAATNAMYESERDKLRTLLATGNQFGVGGDQLRAVMGGIPEYQAVQPGPAGSGPQSYQWNQDTMNDPNRPNNWMYGVPGMLQDQFEAAGMDWSQMASMFSNTYGGGG